MRWTQAGTLSLESVGRTPAAPSASWLTLGELCTHGSSSVNKELTVLLL